MKKFIAISVSTASLLVYYFKKKSSEPQPQEKSPTSGDIILSKPDPVDPVNPKVKPGKTIIPVDIPPQIRQKYSYYVAVAILLPSVVYGLQWILARQTKSKETILQYHRNQKRRQYCGVIFAGISLLIMSPPFIRNFFSKKYFLQICLYLGKALISFKASEWVEKKLYFDAQRGKALDFFLLDETSSEKDLKRKFELKKIIIEPAQGQAYDEEILQRIQRDSEEIYFYHQVLVGSLNEQD